MASIVGEEFYNTQENVTDLSGPAEGPEKNKARQRLPEMSRKG